METQEKAGSLGLAVRQTVDAALRALARPVGGKLTATGGARLPALPQTAPVPGGSGTEDDESERKRVSFGAILKYSFIAAVVVPTLATTLYLLLMASPRYATEARFTVRSGTDTTVASNLIGKALSSLSGSSSSQNTSTAQDAFIALNYIRSRNMIADVGGIPALVSVFKPESTDYFSRLDPEAPMEDIWEYWKDRVVTDFNTVSGIATLRVYASDPQSSLWLSQQILDKTETFLNTLSARVRADALARAEAELATHRERMIDALTAVNSFRDQSGIIDPVLEAKSLGQTIADLTVQKIAAETQLSSGGEMTRNAPSRRILTEQIASLDSQITKLRGQMAGGQTSDVLADKIRTYERLQIESVFATQMYTTAQTAYFEAKSRVDRQALYVVRIVEPSLAETNAYPTPVSTAFIVFMTASVLWSIVALASAAIRDHTA